ncbi:MAG: hypothetical protein WC370_10345 [Dehalococcoidales bacterium]|jgi:Tfp pilus assembly protein PilN/predicted nuclease of predicted toxin-antitoxin system
MIFTTIHISSSNIKLVTIKGKSIFKWEVLPLEPGLVRDGRIVDPPRVGEVIDNLFHSVSVPKNNVIVTVSGLPYTYRVMDFPKMKPTQIHEAMTNNLAGEFAVPMENLYLSWAPVNIKPDAIEYFAIAVDRQYIDSIIETVKFARITNWSLDIRPLALARAAAQSDAIIVSLDYDYVDMVLVQGGQVKNMHIANVDIEVEDSNRGRYYNLFASELAKLISYNSSTKNNEPSSSNIPIFVTGEVLADAMKTGAKEDILEELRSATGCAVEFLATWIESPRLFIEENYATNIGLALRKLKNKAKAGHDFRDIKLDMLLGAYDKKPQTLSIAYIIVPAILVIIVVVITSVISARHQVNTDLDKLHAQLNTADQTLVQALGQQSRENDLRDQINSVNAHIQTSLAEYSEILGNKGKNAGYLEDVTSVLPENSDFSLISMDSDTIRVSGIVDSPFDVITYIRSLQETGYGTLNIEAIGNSDNGTDYPFTVVINDPGNLNGN